MLSLIDVQFQLGFVDHARAELQQITPAEEWNMETQLRYGGLLFELEENEQFEEWKSHLEEKHANTDLSIDQKIRRDVLFAEYAFRSDKYEEAEAYYSSASQLNTQYQHGALLDLLRTQQVLGKNKQAQQLALYLFAEKQDLSS